MAVQDNGYGQVDGLISQMAEALGPAGLTHLKVLVKDLAKTPVPVPPKKERKVVGWAGEALAALDAATGNPRRWTEWHNTRLQVLEALGQGEAAQAQRWQQFEAVLSAEDLRAYLKRLPDFDDIEAEDKALDYALVFEPPEMALYFLCHWPTLDHAAKLVLQLGDKLNGNDYETLTALADALSARHPLAATLALRAMITFALERARTKRYHHAARHLLECESLSAQIEDYGGHADHAAYLAALKQAHGRKASFWERVEG